LAWNEEEAIGPALVSLFGQSLFAWLEAKNARCEILCVTNGCSDRTAAVAEEVCQAQSESHPHRASFSARVCDIQQRGKNNAWNLFVHQLSRREAEYLVLMDGDIVLQHPDTLLNMYRALEKNDEAAIATDCPIKNVAFKRRKGLRDLASLAASQTTQAAPAQVTGQLYCIRTPVARNIHLPRDLVACEDGFIKSLVCTYFLTRESTPERIVQAENASHVFEAYTSLRDLLRNQKRQIIGQTIVHILVDKHLSTLSLDEKLNLAETIQEKEVSDPPWLKRLIGTHLRETRFFWRLYPNLLSSRFIRLRRLRGLRKALYLPMAVVGTTVTLVGAWMARRFLVKGYTDYWPDTRSPGLKDFAGLNNAKPREAALARLTTN
jgi:hypothetical protein